MPAQESSTLAIYKRFGDYLKDEKKGWIVLGEHYPLISDFKARVYGDAVFGRDVRLAVIERLLKDGYIMPDDAALEVGLEND